MNAPQQSGYILFIMIALLAGFGSLFLYSTLNQSGQSQKSLSQTAAMMQLNELKQRLKTIGKNAPKICDPAADSTIFPDPTNDVLLAKLDLAALFGSANYQNHKIDVIMLDKANVINNTPLPASPNPNKKCFNDNDSYDICDTPDISGTTNGTFAILRWRASRELPENQQPQVTLNKTDFNCP